MREQMVALKVELASLRSERSKDAELAAEAARGTAKGRPYEEAVAEAVDLIARGMGDDCDAVGDFRGAGGRKGDVVVDIDGCAGAPRGRIVFEAKHSRRSRKEALTELEEAMAQRAADYGVWVVPSEEQLPARAPALREVGGDKLFVVFDPDEGSLALQVAYSLARARVLMAKGGVEGLDAPALRAEVERALGALEEVRRIKLHLTNAAGGIEAARGVSEIDGRAGAVARGRDRCAGGGRRRVVGAGLGAPGCREPPEWDRRTAPVSGGGRPLTRRAGTETIRWPRGVRNKWVL